MIKKFIILGSGTAGLIAATMIKKRWGDKVQVSLYYDSKKKNIGVGESTTPIVTYFLNQYLEVDMCEFLRETGTTIKLGINFKNWILGKEFFHGFPELDFSNTHYPESLYSILMGVYNGGLNYSKASSTLPGHFFRYVHALHIDTQVFSNYLHNHLKDKIDIIDDIAEEVKSDGKNIQSIIFKNSGEVSADFYIDASGFNAFLFKHLNPEWTDISEWLPIDRAIPQQVPVDFGNEVPSYTLAEATENGWIWRIPIGNRYGTGYLYSSKFTSDEEAREKYDQWLVKNLGVELRTDRIIEYKPGYYNQHYIGNCMAVGLSSGFVEPLESTGIHIIIQQLRDFIDYNSTLNNLVYNRMECNRRNYTLYREIVDFICLHYNTNRIDSDFWKYMTSHKSEWVKAFDQKCREEFLEESSIEKGKEFWHVDSYIQVAQGLEMFNPISIKKFIESLPDGEQILEDCRLRYLEVSRSKKQSMDIPHKAVLNGITVIN